MAENSQHFYRTYGLDDLAQWLSLSPTPLTFDQIRKTFGVSKSSNTLSRKLKQSIEKGTIVQDGKYYTTDKNIDRHMFVRVEPQQNGYLYATPVAWPEGEDIPIILLNKNNAIGKRASPDDVLLVRLKKLDTKGWIATPHINFGSQNNPKLVGTFTRSAQGNDFSSSPPTVEISLPHLKGSFSISVNSYNTYMQHNDQVEIEIDVTAPQRDIEGTVQELLWNSDYPLSRLDDYIFSTENLGQQEEADIETGEFKDSLKILERRHNANENAKPIAELEDVTTLMIDPENAGDHDDAIGIKRDLDPQNPGGTVAYVCIADVAHYIRPQDKLDQRGQQQGYTQYFHSRHNHLFGHGAADKYCSLREGKEARAMVMEIKLNKNGEVLDFGLLRGKFTPTKNLTHEEADEYLASTSQHAQNPISSALKLMESMVETKHSLESFAGLDLGDLKATPKTNENGSIDGFTFKTRSMSTLIVERFMVLANKCAYQLAKEADCTFMSRHHPKPETEQLRDVMRLISSQYGVQHYGDLNSFEIKDVNAILAKIKDPHDREQATKHIMSAIRPASFDVNGGGHWGLGLDKEGEGYAWFTSPIRRYSDLVLHRILIDAYDLGTGGDSPRYDVLSNLAHSLKCREEATKTISNKAMKKYALAELAKHVNEKTPTTVPAKIIQLDKLNTTVKFDTIPGEFTFKTDVLFSGLRFKHDKNPNVIIDKFTNTPYKEGDAIDLYVLSACPFNDDINVSASQMDERRKTPRPSQQHKKYTAPTTDNKKENAVIAAEITDISTKHVTLMLSDGETVDVNPQSFFGSSAKDSRNLATPGLFVFGHGKVFQIGDKLSINSENNKSAHTPPKYTFKRCLEDVQGQDMADNTAPSAIDSGKKWTAIGQGLSALKRIALEAA